MRARIRSTHALPVLGVMLAVWLSICGGASGAAAAECATGDPNYAMTFDMNADLGIFAPLAPGAASGYLLFGDTVGWTGFAGGGNPFHGAPVTRRNAVILYDACTGVWAPATALPELHLGTGERGYSATVPTGAVVAGGALYAHVSYGDVFRDLRPETGMGGMRGHGVWAYGAAGWSFVPSWLSPEPPPMSEWEQVNDDHADGDPFLQSALTLSLDGTALWVFGANSNILGGAIHAGRVAIRDGEPDWMTGQRVVTWQVGGQVRDLSAYTAASGLIYVMWLDDESGSKITYFNPTGAGGQANALMVHREIDALGSLGYGGSILDVRDSGDGSRWYLIASSDAWSYTTSVRWVRNARAQVAWERDLACVLAGDCPATSRTTALVAAGSAAARPADREPRPQPSRATIPIHAATRADHLPAKRGRPR